MAKKHAFLCSEPRLHFGVVRNSLNTTESIEVSRILVRPTAGTRDVHARASNGNHSPWVPMTNIRSRARAERQRPATRGHRFDERCAAREPLLFPGCFEPGCVRLIACNGSAAHTLGGTMPKPRLLQSMRANLRLRHFSPRTKEAYTAWTRRFVRFHELRHPSELGETEVKAFLIHLAQERQVAPSTLAQALAALLFLYKEVLGRPLAGLGAMPRARAPVRLPVVLSPEEVRRVLEHMRGVTRLVALLLYGGGMRLMECLTLRIKDLDIERGEIRIRRGKGAKDRVTILPAILRSALAAQVELSGDCINMTVVSGSMRGG